MEKLTLKQKIELKNQLLKESIKKKEEYEINNMGGYDRIYPLDMTEYSETNILL